MKKFKSALLKTITMACCSLFVLHNAKAQSIEEVEGTEMKSPKILIAYYSYSGNTEQVAQAIQKQTGGDLFKITTEGTYPEDYHQMTTQAKKEILQGYRPKLTSKIDNIADYDVIFLGSPNWWGTITPQVSSFLQSYDLSGKKVIPFVTHGGGGQQNTITDMAAQCKGCLMEPNPWTGYGNSMSGLSDWIDNLGL